MDMMGPMGNWLSTALDTTAARHRAVLENMANVNTPGYRAKAVEFDQRLKEAKVTEREGLVLRQDGNNVTMEVERGELTKNNLAHQLYLEMLRHETSLVRAAIRGSVG